MKKRLFTGLLALMMVYGLLPGSTLAAESAVVLSDAVAETAAYILGAVPEPQVASIGGEWAIIGLARGGISVPEGYYDSYYANLEQVLNDAEGVLSTTKNTEYSRVILALTSIGKDPADVAGYNLLTPLGDYDATIKQGINGAIFALLALDSGAYDMPVNAQAQTQATRQMYVDTILERQLADGGWALSGDSADPDITAMALQALSLYRAQDAVAQAIERGVTRLSGMQKENGGYAGWGSVNVESLSQVIVALTALDIDLTDERFVKEGNTLLDTLLSYRLEGGAFRHDDSGSGNSQMSTEQAFFAMVSALRAQQGKSSLYHMSDTAVHESATSGALPTVTVGEKHSDIKVPEITEPGKTFPDISGHVNQNAIEALAARGIITGGVGGTFAPDDNMTRAEFAAIIVRGLGLAPSVTSHFRDVDPEKWYAGYIETAFAYGIVKGKDDAGNYDPDAQITRQEAAIMVCRAAKICGLSMELTSSEVEVILSSFSDGTGIADWASSETAFCVLAGILDTGTAIRPTDNVKRCEIAQMLYNTLVLAGLLSE